MRLSIIIVQLLFLLPIISCENKDENYSVSVNENNISSSTEDFNEIVSDSIIFSLKLHDYLNFINTKKNKTSALILNENGDTLLIINPLKEKENSIEIDNLKKGIYIFEAYDINGLLMRRRFVKK